MGKKGLGASSGLFSRRGRKALSGGFTLLELVMTVAIVGILAAVVLPLYLNYLEKARVGRAIAEIRGFAKAIDAFELHVGVFPDTLDAVTIRANQPDPWGNPYQYQKLAGLGNPGKGKGGGGGVPPGRRRNVSDKESINADYDLYSMGKDGKSVPPLNGQPAWDDVIRLDGGDFVDLGWKY